MRDLNFKRILLILFALSAFPIATFANYYADGVCFYPENYQNVTADTGLTVSMDMPIGAYAALDAQGISDSSGLYKSGALAVSVAGVLATFKNESDQLYIIHFAKSNISLGYITAVPFVDGMHYKDAGNPAATPDLIVPPHQSVTKAIYAAYYTLLSDWSLLNTSIPVREDRSVKGALYLNVQQAGFPEKYITVSIPPIYVKPLRP